MTMQLTCGLLRVKTCSFPRVYLDPELRDTNRVAWQETCSNLQRRANRKHLPIASRPIVVMARVSAVYWVGQHLWL